MNKIRGGLPWRLSYEWHTSVTALYSYHCMKRIPGEQLPDISVIKYPGCKVYIILLNCEIVVSD